MFLSIDADGWSGRVTCEVTLAGGTIDKVGVFRLAGSYGAWGAPLSASASAVRSARLVAADGAVLASARFSS
jgi:hypothetical protein